MSLSTHTAGHVTVLSLDRVLTYSSGVELLAELDASSGRGVHWLLDMTAVTYIDSAGLGALIDTYRRIQARGGALKFLHMQPRGRHLLAITGLTDIFESFDSEAAALASFPSESSLDRIAL